MKKLKISEVEKRELEQELERLCAMIDETNSSHGNLAAEEKGLFNNPAARIAAMDLDRWIGRRTQILDILANAEVIKINVESDNMEVEIGDVVTLNICYEGMNPRCMSVQIAGEHNDQNVKQLTYDSALAQAILGKKAGEQFESYKTDKLAKTFMGTIETIVKAKELTDTKSAYVLKK